MPNRSSGEKTKIVLADSLRRLMKKKPLDKIKIREIVDECGLNRQTFYYHFQDIYALVEWMYKFDGRNIVNKYLHNKDIHTCCKEMIAYLEENREELLCIMDSKAEIYFFEFLYDGVKSCFNYLIKTKAVSIGISEEYITFLSELNTNAIIGVVRTWLKSTDSNRISGDRLLELFDISTKGSLKLAFNNYLKSVKE